MAEGFLAKLSGFFSKKPEQAEGFHTEAELAAKLKEYYPDGAPLVSIVAVLYNKAYAVPIFLEAVYRQFYPGPIEVVFVGDKSPDRSIAAARKTAKSLVAEFSSRSHPVTVRLFTNDEKLGNCFSLNVGREKAAGELIVFADADCLLNRLFLAHNVLALAQGHDICTGPVLKHHNTETAAKALLNYEKKPHLVQKAVGESFGAEIAVPELHVYCDCKTRNFCAKNSALPNPLFDELYSLEKGAQKNCCVEGADMGQLLAESSGLRMTWSPGAFTLRLGEPPIKILAEDDDDD